MEKEIPKEHRSEILTPGAHLYLVSDWETRAWVAGERVVIHAQGKFRTAQVDAEGPKRIRTTRTNPNTGNTFTKAVGRAEVYTLNGEDREFAGVVRERSTGGQYLET